MAQVTTTIAIETEHKLDPDHGIDHGTGFPLRAWSVSLRDARPGYEHLYPVIPYIQRVVFDLHDTFQNPQRVTTHPPYGVKEKGWGEFEMKITIYWADDSQPPEVIMHDLNFQTDAKYVMQKVITFHSPSSKLRELLNRKSRVSRKTVPTARKGLPRKTPATASKSTVGSRSTMNHSASSDEDDYSSDLSDLSELDSCSERSSGGASKNDARKPQTKRTSYGPHTKNIQKDVLINDNLPEPKSPLKRKLPGKNLDIGVHANVNASAITMPLYVKSETCARIEDNSHSSIGLNQNPRSASKKKSTSAIAAMKRNFLKNRYTYTAHSNNFANQKSKIDTTKRGTAPKAASSTTKHSLLVEPVSSNSTDGKKRRHRASISSVSSSSTDVSVSQKKKRKTELVERSSWQNDRSKHVTKDELLPPSSRKNATTDAGIKKKRIQDRARASDKELYPPQSGNDGISRKKLHGNSPIATKEGRLAIPTTSGISRTPKIRETKPSPSSHSSSSLSPRNTSPVPRNIFPARQQTPNSARKTTKLAPTQYQAGAGASIPESAVSSSPRTKTINREPPLNHTPNNVSVEDAVKKLPKMKRRSKIAPSKSESLGRSSQAQPTALVATDHEQQRNADRQKNRSRNPDKPLANEDIRKVATASSTPTSKRTTKRISPTTHRSDNEREKDRTPEKKAGGGASRISSIANSAATDRVKAAPTASSGLRSSSGKTLKSSSTESHASATHEGAQDTSPDAAKNKANQPTQKDDIKRNRSSSISAGRSQKATDAKPIIGLSREMQLEILNTKIQTLDENDVVQFVALAHRLILQQSPPSSAKSNGASKNGGHDPITQKAMQQIADDDTYELDVESLNSSALDQLCTFLTKATST
ncbi:transcription factor TFIIF complex subunit Tfg3 [Mycoemilia scoparia]|uniref:Protein AF-9 homolog n=1 Tax=Mycoemilia scoparia TaxID=417184 RepID=A0A9W8DQ09_9FUNG|nr:transcription factor TFIIF complex subunit Tfg3 [Mycoemilia scoparia]